jgi:hypothetical protein
MSVIVPISSLTPTVIKKLDKDLHVKSIVQPLKTQVSSKLVEAFDTFSEGKYATIPFNYYYHHLENIERIPNDDFKPISLLFEQHKQCNLARIQRLNSLHLHSMLEIIKLLFTNLNFIYFAFTGL